jgi:hypothetical protein
MFKQNPIHKLLENTDPEKLLKAEEEKLLLIESDSDGFNHDRVQIKDLCVEDKKRIADLIKELAK